jgi:hypothetical protein
MASQGKLDESLLYHQRALRQFHATIGKNHHRTGDVHVRLAEHYAGAGRLNDAMYVICRLLIEEMLIHKGHREHLDEAVRIFNRPVFKPEMARATFRKSKVLEMNGQVEHARILREESIRSYREIRNQAEAGSEVPSGADFDDIVAFWSR